MKKLFEKDSLGTNWTEYNAGWFIKWNAMCTIKALPSWRITQLEKKLWIQLKLFHRHNVMSSTLNLPKALTEFPANFL